MSTVEINAEVDSLDTYNLIEITNELSINDEAETHISFEFDENNQAELELIREQIANAVKQRNESASTLPETPDTELRFRVNREDLCRSLAQIRQMKPEVVKSQFEDLKSRWINECKFISSSPQIRNNENYKEIIKLGDDVVPLILHDLTEQPNHWFYALEQITGACPTGPEDHGDIQALSQKWIEWGKNEGYEF